MPVPDSRLSRFKDRLGELFALRFESKIWIIALLNLLSAAGFSLTIPFLSLYLFLDRGVSMTLIGTIILAGGILSAATHMLGGELSDRLGRRPILLISNGVRVLMFLGMAVLIGNSAPVWAISLVYILGQSIGMVVRPVLSAMVIDLVPKRRLTETYGFLRVAVNLGWAIGPAVGGYLATFLHYSWLFGVAALITSIGFFIVLFFIRESLHRTDTITTTPGYSLIKDRFFLLFTGLSFLIILVAAQMMSTLSVFSVDRLGMSTAQYGLLLTVNGLVVVLFQYPTARIVNSMIKSRVLIVGSLLYAIGYLLFGWAGGFSLAVVAMIIITLGEIVFSPVALSIVGELAPGKHRGRYMGFYELSHTLGFTAGPLAGGLLMDAFPTRSLPIWGTIALTAVAVGLGFHFIRKKINQISPRRMINLK